MKMYEVQSKCMGTKELHRYNEWVQPRDDDDDDGRVPKKADLRHFSSFFFV